MHHSDALTQTKSPHLRAFFLQQKSQWTSPLLSMLAINWQDAAQRRQTSAHSCRVLFSPGAIPSHISAQSSHIAAHSSHVLKWYCDSRLISSASSAQIAAQSMHRAMHCPMPGFSIAMHSAAHCWQILEQSRQLRMQSCRLCIICGLYCVVLVCSMSISFHTCVSGLLQIVIMLKSEDRICQTLAESLSDESWNAALQIQDFLRKGE